MSQGGTIARRQPPVSDHDILPVSTTPIGTSHLQATEPFWPFAETPTQLVGKMKGKFTSFENGIYELRKDDQIFTDNYPTPVAFELMARTDKYELRFGYIEKEMIFNWGSNFDEFRVGSGPAADKGPFDGRHVPSQGRIPENEWVKIVVIATLDSLEIWADGTQRFFGKADLSRFNEPFRVSQWGLSVVQVKSLFVGLPRGIDAQTKYVAETTIQSTGHRLCGIWKHQKGVSLLVRYWQKRRNVSGLSAGTFQKAQPRPTDQ